MARKEEFVVIDCNEIFKETDVVDDKTLVEAVVMVEKVEELGDD